MIMRSLKYPPAGEWEKLCLRPVQQGPDITAAVQDILDTVAAQGDEALRAYALKYEGCAPESLAVTEAEFKAAAGQVSAGLAEAITQAAANIRAYHARQVPAEAAVPGGDVSCWRRHVPIERVGLYVPGGTAPLFSSLLMLAIPAQLAGCKNITVCTPCNSAGQVSPVILHTAAMLGIKNVYKAGGVQAIAAMAMGTQSIQPVYKIFGPGNGWVTRAKALVQAQRGTAIDMPAGPSEVLVIAGRGAVPAYAAADLLSQAEHGADSQVILLTDDEAMLQAVQAEVEKQLEMLPRKDIARQALQKSLAVLLEDVEACIAFSNTYAPEHLILAMDGYERYAGKVTNAGSVFLGNYAPESAGDYASGTNHTLPTSGYARAYSGLGVESFMKTISYQHLTKQGLAQLADTITAMAEAEGLQAHKRAVTIRMEDMQ